MRSHSEAEKQEGKTAKDPGMSFFTSAAATRFFVHCKHRDEANSLDEGELYCNIKS